MKTILVLTDFSKSARNAAETAMLIAEKLNADILLFNAFRAPALMPFVEIDKETEKVQGILKRQNNDLLLKEAHRLGTLLDNRKGVQREPVIKCKSAEGSLSANIQTILKEKDIIMIVMGGRSKVNLGRFLSSDIYSVLNKTTCPVLIVPEVRVGFEVKNLVFATDMKTEDLTAVKFLAKLSRKMNFQIHVSQVSEKVPAMDFFETKNITGLTKMASTLNLKKLSFKNLSGDNFGKMLGGFTKSVNADLLAFVHKKHILFWQLFNDSHKQVLAKDQKTPLLIFPEFWINHHVKPKQIKSLA